MPEVNFAVVDDVDDYSPLPDGEYLCHLSEIEDTVTQYNDEMWKLKFEVDEGEYLGRCIFDNMVFSERAMKRVKLICSRLGLDVSGKIDLMPKLLKGRRCYISVLTEEYTDNEGRVKKRNVVPFAGYKQTENIGQVSVVDDDGEDNMPF